MWGVVSGQVVDGSAFSRVVGMCSKDPELLDDEPHEPMTIQTRLAAEREKLGTRRGAKPCGAFVTWMWVKLCDNTT